LSKENYYSEADFKLTKLTLTKGVEVIDLTGVYGDITIYESMTDQCMSGSVSILDVHNINERTPICGNEIIEIEFATAGSSVSINVQGIVYKVDANTRMSQTSSCYVIWFMDEFMYRNARTVYRYGHTCEWSKMIELIYKNTMKNNKTKLKTIDTVATVGIETWVGNKRPPLYTINKIAERSFSKSNEYGYVFWEDSDSFNFKPLEYLYQQEPVTEFINKDNGIYKDVKQRTVERFTAIQDIKFNQSSNSHGDKIKDGVHGSSWYSIDLVSKDLLEFNYNKSTQFNKDKSLGEYAHQYNDIEEDTYDDFHIMEVQPNTPSGLKPKALNIMQLKNAETFSATILCNGDSSLRTGQIAKINLPNWNNSANTDSTTTYNGKVLISQIKHIITHKTYTQQIVITKDAYASEFLQ